MKKPHLTPIEGAHADFLAGRPPFPPAYTSPKWEARQAEWDKRRREQEEAQTAELMALIDEVAANDESAPETRDLVESSVEHAVEAPRPSPGPARVEVSGGTSLVPSTAPEATACSPAPLASVMPKPAPAPPGASSYSFPEFQPEMDGDSLRRELEAIHREFRATADYPAIRERFCAASLALNRAGLWAPQFRPQPRIPPKPRSAANDLLHKDHVVIDVHWLWSVRAGSTAAGSYGDLLDHEHPFDFKLASEYANRNWRSRYRADEEFGLPDAVQWQLVTVKSATHVKKHQNLMHGDRAAGLSSMISGARKRINEAAFRNHRLRGQQLVYLELWQATQMLGPAATRRELAELLAYIGGAVPLDESTIRQKMRTLDKIFGGTT